MLFSCESMSRFREDCYIGEFVRYHRTLKPTISPNKLYYIFMSDEDPDSIPKKAIALYSMLMGWHALQNLPFPTQR